MADDGVEDDRRATRDAALGGRCGDTRLDRRPSAHQGSGHPIHSRTREPRRRTVCEALCRTRTGGLFLTMAVRPSRPLLPRRTKPLRSGASRRWTRPYRPARSTPPVPTGYPAPRGAFRARARAVTPRQSERTPKSRRLRVRLHQRERRGWLAARPRGGGQPRLGRLGARVHVRRVAGRPWGCPGVGG